MQDGPLIIVEGKNDKKALANIGLCNVIAISGKNYDTLLGELNDKKIKTVAILTDFDKEGEKKHKQLRRIFERSGIKVEPAIRIRFKATFNVNKIEELCSSAGVFTGQGLDNPTFLTKTLSTRKFFVKSQSKKKLWLRE